MNKKSYQMLVNWLPLLISTIGFFFSHVLHISFICLPSDSSFHFNLVTINALFGGFLFTGFSLMIGFLDNKVIDKLKCTDIIKQRNRHILKGIVYSVVSVCSSLMFVLLPQSDTPMTVLLKCALCNIEITFMFFGLGYFLLSLKEMSSLVEKLYTGNRKSQEVLNEIDQILDNTKH